MLKLPAGVALFQVTGFCPASVRRKETFLRCSVLVLTFLAYTSYHLSRKPISIVKNSAAFLDCGVKHGDNATCSSFISQIDGMDEQEAKTTLGLLDTSYLFSYAFFMFWSGFLAERMDLRYFLTLGMMLSGLFTFLFGFAFYYNIHSLAYFIFIQVALGLFQASGWPGVVSVMANWFGKGRRGLIMGLWNSHTSLGNILGSLIAGAFVTYNWGLSFIVPGVIIASVGFLLFLFLVPRPSDIGLPEATSANNRSDDVPAATETDPLMEDKDDHDVDMIDDEEIVIMHTEERAIGFLGALKIPGVLEFSFCLFFAKLVSYTFLYWLPNYIHSVYTVDAQESAILSTIFDLGGIVGGIIAGIVSDSTGNPATTCAVMLVTAIPTLFLYDGMEEWCPITAHKGIPDHDACFNLNIVLTFVMGTLVNGPYALITTAVSAELGQHPSLRGSSKALATVTAIIDGTGSIGAAIGPLLAGALSGSGDWNRVFDMLMVADVLALLFLTRLIIQEYIQWRPTMLAAIERWRERRRNRSDVDYQSINS